MVKKIHYANLNSLRFIAAFVVIIHHTEQIKFAKGMTNLWLTDVVPLLGKLGVDLFFVLSGFLITSLLFVEKSSVPEISVKNFIIRRLLRIWPLYFIIMILGFFIMPQFPKLELGVPFVNVNDHMTSNIFMYVLFIPHVQLVVFGPILYSAQAWSIGIEEQFYLVWPFIVKYFDQKKLVKLIVTYITVYLFVSVVLAFLVHKKITFGYFSLTFLERSATFIIDILKFDCLLIGGLFAVINNTINEDSIFVNKYFQIIVYIIEITLICVGFNFHILVWEVHAVLYGFIIMNLVRTKTSILNLEHSVFDYLGKISYGIYMYHVLIINIVVTILYQLNLTVLIYPVIFISVILISSLSYKFIEGYFLRKKSSFSVISTG